MRQQELSFTKFAVCTELKVAYILSVKSAAAACSVLALLPLLLSWLACVASKGLLAPERLLSLGLLEVLKLSAASSAADWNTIVPCRAIGMRGSLACRMRDRHSGQAVVCACNTSNSDGLSVSGCASHLSALVNAEKYTIHLQTHYDAACAPCLFRLHIQHTALAYKYSV